MTEYINRERARFEAKRYFKNMDEIQEDLDMLFCMLPAENVAPMQEWISVEDKLPPYNRDVLVYRPNMAMKILVDNYAWHYRDDDDEWYEDWALSGKDANGNPVVTHWAYLPQPPKGE